MRAVLLACRGLVPAFDVPGLTWTGPRGRSVHVGHARRAGTLNFASHLVRFGACGVVVALALELNPSLKARVC
jgi:hypothetical protein